MNIDGSASPVWSGMVPDRVVLETAARGDRNAAREFLTRYRDLAFRKLRPACGDHYSASELTDDFLAGFLAELRVTPPERIDLKLVLARAEEYRMKIQSSRHATGLSPRQKNILGWLDVLKPIERLVAELLMVQQLPEKVVAERLELTPDALLDIQSRLLIQVESRLVSRKKELDETKRKPAGPARFAGPRRDRPVQKHPRPASGRRFDRPDHRHGRPQNPR